MKETKIDYVGLIDADFIKYLVVYDIQKMYKKGLKTNVKIPYNTVIALIEKRIQKIFEQTQDITKEYLFLFSGKTSNNYRFNIANVKKYKGHRKYVDKIPNEGICRNIVEEYIENTYHYFREEELEADDLCVMAHSKDTYIYSNDKDLRSSSGLHYDIKNEKFFEVSIPKGFHSLLTQTITGDSVDNIAGIEGIGKVGADKITKGKHGIDLITSVISAYINKYNNKDGLDRFVEMYSLVSLKTNRGDWTNEKYKLFFNKVSELINYKDDNLF